MDQLFIFFTSFWPYYMSAIQMNISKCLKWQVTNLKSHLNVALHPSCDYIYARHRSEILRNIFSPWAKEWNSVLWNKWWWYQRPLSAGGFSTGTEVVTFLTRKTTLWDRRRKQCGGFFGRGWGCLLGHLGFDRLRSPLRSSLTDLF